MRRPDDPMSQAGWGRRQRGSLSERDPAFGDTGPGSPGGGSGWGFAIVACAVAAVAAAGGFEAVGLTAKGASGFARLSYAIVILAGLWMVAGAPRPSVFSQLFGVGLIGVGFLLLIVTEPSGALA